MAIDAHSKSDVVKNSSSLFKFFFYAFDLRRLCVAEKLEDVYELSEVDDAESQLTEVALAMTLKLNDATFRPFFIRFVEWAASELPKKDKTGRVLRCTSLFVFLGALF